MQLDSDVVQTFRCQYDAMNVILEVDDGMRGTKIRGSPMEPDECTFSANFGFNRGDGKVISQTVLQNG